jgi:hypothetical protein
VWRYRFSFLYLLLFFLQPVPTALAQSQIAVADSLPAIQKVRLARLVFNFDARYSFIDRESVRISGVKVGVEWKETVRTGLGMYFLSSTLHGMVPDPAGSTVPLEARLRFGYFAGFAEYILHHSERWEVSVPLQAGMGTLFYEFFDSDGKPHRVDRQGIFLVEPSVSGHYKLFYWIGVGAGAGYRQIINPEIKLAHDLNAPIYYLKIKLFIGELIKQQSAKCQLRKDSRKKTIPGFVPE